MRSVTLERTPSGFPRASVRSPTSTREESANVAGRGRAPAMRITARSFAASRPMAVAGRLSPRGQHDDEARRVPDDVRVGDNVAAGIEDHARAEVLRCLDLHDRRRDGPHARHSGRGPGRSQGGHFLPQRSRNAVELRAIARSHAGGDVISSRCGSLEMSQVGPTGTVCSPAVRAIVPASSRRAVMVSRSSSARVTCDHHHSGHGLTARLLVVRLGTVACDGQRFCFLT